MSKYGDNTKKVARTMAQTAHAPNARLTEVSYSQRTNMINAQ